MRFKLPPRYENRKHLQFVSTLPCLVCGKMGENQVHHLMRGVFRGMARKADDNQVIPLCIKHHDELHRSNETLFLETFGIDGLEWAKTIYQASGDDYLIEKINARDPYPW